MRNDREIIIVLIILYERERERERDLNIFVRKSPFIFSMFLKFYYIFQSLYIVYPWKVWK
ncbi:unnamed protein product [Musa acuminata var. zebrina]